VNHLKICKLDENRFKKLIKLFKELQKTCTKPDQLVTVFANKCYAQEKDRKLAELHALTFMDALFGTVENVLEHGPETAIARTLNAQYPMLQQPRDQKSCVVKVEMRKSPRFNSLLHNLDSKDIGKHHMWTKKLKHYLVGPTLGVGGTAKVKLGYNTLTKTKVAMKILKPKHAPSAAKEINILKKLNHKNVIRVYDCFTNVIWNKQKTTVFSIEYASQGDLIEYLMYTSKFEDDLARWFFSSLTEGVEYCHGQKIIHRDLKHDNCLLGDNFELKITDFGFATIWKDDFMKTAIGTEQYAAPEIIKGEKYTDAVDIFSMGVMLFIALAASWPWRKASAKSDQRYKMARAGEWGKFFKYHERSHKFTNDQKVILRGLLEHNPKNRWKIKDIKRSKWFNGRNLPQKEVAELLKGRKRKVDIKKYRAMRQGGKVTRRGGDINIFTHGLPWVYFQPVPRLSFVTDEKPEWVLGHIANAIGDLKGDVTTQDKEKYKLTFSVTKLIETGGYIAKATKEYEKVRVCGSAQIWTLPGQEQALADLEKVVSDTMENKNSMVEELNEAVTKNIPTIKSIAIFRAEGGGLTKYLFPEIYSDILLALPADLISTEIFNDEYIMSSNIS